MSKKTIILLAVTIITFSSIILPGCEVIEQPYQYYQTYDPSLHDGMWVPNIFPHDIVEIYEQHVIDTSEVWLRFSLSDQEFDPSKIGYEPIQSIQLSEIIYRFPFTPPWRKRWWFQTFGREVTLEDRLPEARIYKGKNLNHAAYIAVDKSTSTIYWWSK
ncbi:MAG: hypothetical protein JXA50_06480 [Deltaproteobacteria bacterium]|nr:hypothetical protein [Deltaproteobacteria bacterium]